MPGGHEEEFPIRMVECLTCHERFSLLPSFLPREKHFCIDMIGSVLSVSIKIYWLRKQNLNDIHIRSGHTKQVI